MGQNDKVRVLKGKPGRYSEGMVGKVVDMKNTSRRIAVVLDQQPGILRFIEPTDLEKLPQES